MAKLSELLVRRLPREGSAEFTASGATEAPPEGDAEALEAEGDPEISAKLGEECEALRNLIVEAGCKINELEETKQTFFQIVDPADRALRLLEQAQTRNISLSRRIGQLRTAYDGLQARFDEIEKQIQTAVGEKEQIRQELEDSQRTVRELKGVKAELTNDVAVVRAMAANLEHHVADLTGRHKTLGEDNQRFRGQAIEAETRVNGLEGELTAVRESLAIREGENQSLQQSLGQAVAEVSQLSQRNTEMESQLASATARVQQLEATLYTVENERNRLLTEFSELSERQRNAHTRLQAQAEALAARAAMAEKLLGNTRQLLVARSEEARASDRQTTEVKRARDAAEVKVREIEALLKTHENHIRELERSRSVLSERNTALANSLKAREAQLAETDQLKMVSTDQITRLEDDLKINRMTYEKRIEDLLSLLDHERLERQVVEGALDATRAERANLQHEMYKLRTAMRRGRQSDGAEPPPARREEAPGRSADAA